MSADGETTLDEEQQRIFTDAADRIRELMERAHAASLAVIREAADEVDEISRQVLDTTGVRIVTHPPDSKVPAVMDVRISALADRAEQCMHLLAGVELLAPYAAGMAEKTVGSLLKTSVDPETGALIRQHLARSGFYAAEEGTS